MATLSSFPSINNNRNSEFSCSNQHLREGLKKFIHPLHLILLCITIWGGDSMRMCGYSLSTTPYSPLLRFGILPTPFSPWKVLCSNFLLTWQKYFPELVLPSFTVFIIRPEKVFCSFFLLFWYMYPFNLLDNVKPGPFWSDAHDRPFWNYQ